MAFDGSFSATLSPTGSEAFGSHMLSNSISSLVSSPRVAPSQISKTYRQASQLFLTRRLPEALSTLLPLITPSTEGSDVNGLTEPAPVVRASRATRIKVWSLYLTILNAVLELDPEEGKDAFGTQEWRTLCQKVRNGDVWEEVVQFGYHGVEGDVDSDVVINLATLLLAHARSQVVNQKRLENFLASSNTPNLDISRQLEAARSQRPSSRNGRSTSKGATGGTDTPRDLNARVKILELYTLHVLLRNNEWDYAREFISVSAVLDEERREAFLQALQSLQEEQQAAQQREREEQQKQEDDLRRDIENARRLRAENEARERRRLEEEQAKREASEVDYGIEQSPPHSSLGKARNTGNGSALTKSAQSPSSTPKVKKAVAPPGLRARAAMIIANLQAIMEQIGISLRANPAMLMRLIAFIVSIIVVFSRRDLRERIQRILGSGWNKVKQTAGMGVKVSYL
ncbi:putative peroxin 26 [Rosellinia necatrix]|uniref:Putative peroxin 26 n=1 Tax=Rosellinia necatrix TaxID=77044 RepID=A0A1S8A6P4_ROSNE|nr:putative peroxin 26 [Rosellinia necatrix]